MFTGTKKNLLDVIKRSGTISIDEIVERIDLAKTTLREHLLQLERDGYVKRDYIRSGPGRPSLQYQLSAKGESLYPSSESKLMKEMIKHLKSGDNEEILEDFFEIFWDERLDQARTMMDEASSDDPKKRVAELMNMLEEEGFMPEFDISEDTKTLTVKECNCPFSEVVKETRLPCKLEAMFYKKLFSDQAERTTYIADGDFACEYNIPMNIN